MSASTTDKDVKLNVNFLGNTAAKPKLSKGRKIAAFWKLRWRLERPGWVESGQFNYGSYPAHVDPKLPVRFRPC